MMLTGAFFGILAADKAGSWVLGLLFAMLAGGLLALVLAFFSIHLRADQIVTGTALNFLALGITGYLYIDIYGTQGVPTDVSRIPDVSLPLIEDLYFLGPVLGDLNLMIWLGLLLVVVAHVVLFKTPIGLRIRAVGEQPRAADSVGISVYGVRYACVIASGMLAALGGAYLSFGFSGAFAENMTKGRGFIALAALIFGNWRPFPTLAAALLFEPPAPDRVRRWAGPARSASAAVVALLLIFVWQFYIDTPLPFPRWVIPMIGAGLIVVAAGSAALYCGGAATSGRL